MLARSSNQRRNEERDNGFDDNNPTRRRARIVQLNVDVIQGDTEDNSNLIEVLDTVSDGDAAEDRKSGGLQQQPKTIHARSFEPTPSIQDEKKLRAAC